MYYEVNISLFGLCVISGVADIRFSTKVLTNLSSFQLYLCLRQRKHLPCNLAIFIYIIFSSVFFSLGTTSFRTDFSSNLSIFYFTALPIFYVTALAVNIPFQGFSRPNIKTTLSTGNSGFKLLTVYNDFSHSAVRSEK